MREPVWKSLVESLSDTEFESPYLDRLRSRVEIAQERSSLEREIVQEMAQALGKAEDKVNVALLELQLIEQKLAIASGEGERGHLIASFNTQRDRAKQVLRELVIHREALGMHRNEILREFYPIPERKPFGKKGPASY
jgi:DNA-binding helix-hairpin-helix protein with protein kinase domain